MERGLPRGERLLLGVEGEGVDWPWECGVGVLMRKTSASPEGRGPGSGNGHWRREPCQRRKWQLSSSFRLLRTVKKKR